MYKIEKGVPTREGKMTRWAGLAEDMIVGDSIVVADRSEATGLIWALKKRGKTVKTSKEEVGKGGKVRVFCTGEV